MLIVEPIVAIETTYRVKDASSLLLLVDQQKSVLIVIDHMLFSRDHVFSLPVHTIACSFLLPLFTQSRAIMSSWPPLHAIPML